MDDLEDEIEAVFTEVLSTDAEEKERRLRASIREALEAGQVACTEPDGTCWTEGCTCFGGRCKMFVVLDEGD